MVTPSWWRVHNRICLHAQCEGLCYFVMYRQSEFIRVYRFLRIEILGKLWFSLLFVLYEILGHMTGYIKTWHLVNYCVREEDKVHISMPRLRLQFPFLMNDRILGRAKRAHRSNKPLLVNSYKAHLKPVTGLIFINTVQILIRYS